MMLLTVFQNQYLSTLNNVQMTRDGRVKNSVAQYPSDSSRESLSRMLFLPS